MNLDGMHVSGVTQLKGPGIRGAQTGFGVGIVGWEVWQGFVRVRAKYLEVA